METLQRSNSPSLESVRMTGVYHPSIWGDYFLSIDPIPQKKLESLMPRKNDLKEEILRMFKETTDSLQIMELIDLIQQLGVCYQFENEISKALCTIQKASACDYENDLNAVALRFRLLRQNRIYVHVEVFDKFLDEKGNFKESLSIDAKALLSLYEAVHMAMPNEDVMDKALEFSKTNLEAMQCNLGPYLAEMVSASLDVPLLRRTNRLKTRIYLSVYEHDSQCNQVVLNFAKMDFVCLQAIHQEEARILSKWWSALEMSKRMPFSRDRLVEGYFWVLSAYFEPCYSRGRLMMTKVITLMSILDDIYDNYGTIEELNLLTMAIQGWETEGLSELPDYMQHCFRTIIDVFKECETELEPENNSFRLEYVKYELKKVVRAYHQEAIWANKGYVPNLEEHLSVTLLTAGYSFLACASYIGMHANIPKDVFEWAISLPEIVKQSCVIGRVMNDIVSYEREQERTHVASTVHCYVKEHQCSEEDACTKLLEMTKNAWKIINKELVMHVNIPYFLVSPVLNLARYNDYVYHGKDIYTHAEDYMKERVHAVLVEPIQINISKE